MRRFVLTSLAIVLVVPVLACSSMNVQADHDSQHDFSRYQSFAIFERQGKEAKRPQMSPLVDRRIGSAMAAELRAKGFASTSPRQAAGPSTAPPGRPRCGRAR